MPGRARLLVPLLGLLLASATAQAGHGLLNAFGDIEWLPPPGRTPADTGYALDRAAEAARLAIAGPQARFALLLDYQREKLAEVDALVRADRGAAAARAVAVYVDYLEQAAALATATGDGAAQRARTLASALLEHQYILSVNYLDMPRDARRVIGEVMASAATHYEHLVARLPREYKEAQFFKEEEVRWSWEVARQADAQGL